MCDQPDLFDDQPRPFDPWRDIVEFHKKFRVPANAEPGELLQEMADFRQVFLEEEFREYCEAYSIDPDYKYQRLEQMFDALIDLVYVAIGTAYLHGFDFPKGWERVHAANMKKIRTESSDASKRGSSFDVVKPEGWKAPVLRDLVTESRARIVAVPRTEGTTSVSYPWQAYSPEKPDIGVHYGRTQEEAMKKAQEALDQLT